jgi:hypothetical protein
MKKLILLIAIIFATFSFSKAQEQTTNSICQYGHTLNLGLGIGGYAGYYGYIGHALPVFHIDYELGVARNFTLAPFVNFYTYSDDYYWNHNNYYYHETVIPFGLKGTYYFNRLLKINAPNWEFYVAGSLGFSIVNSRWDNGYNGDRNYYQSGNPLFLDLHIGTKYHISSKVGIFLDISTGVSTVGIAIH